MNSGKISAQNIEQMLFVFLEEVVPVVGSKTMLRTVSELRAVSALVAVSALMAA